MRYISLFSGIEAATVAAEGLGWEPVCFAEIDPFPSAVLAYHYPEVPNLGDITKVDWMPYRGKCDLIVGRSPCQSFSIAGKREGLNGASGLMWEYVRAIREVCPQWVVWENVPGALSSSGGNDFRCLLSALDELGYGLAWRILDTQFFGVPQRRRRVFLVGHFGAQPPTEILFEPESLRGDFETSRKKREAITARAGRCAEGASKGIKHTTCLCIADDNAHAAIDQDVCGTLKVDGAAPMIAYDEV
jgi:DNA (cytosine-5)-methyltransferase 1